MTNEASTQETSIKKPRVLGIRHYSNAFIASVINMHLVTGKSYNEIGKLLNINESTVRHFIKFHYYGITNGPTTIIVKQSKINEPNQKVA